MVNEYSMQQQILTKFQPDQSTFGRMAAEKPVFDQRTAVPCMWHGRQHEFLQIAVCLNCFRTGFITVHTLQ